MCICNSQSVWGVGADGFNGPCIELICITDKWVC